MMKNAERTVAGAVVAASVTGFVPVPFADAPLLIAEQVAMMGIIAKIFKIDIKDDGIKALATAAVGTAGATLVGRTLVSSIFKFIPGIGWLVGGTISAATAGIITYALGHAFIAMCKAVRLGEFKADELTSENGIDIFTGYFRDLIMQKSKIKDAIDSILSSRNTDFDVEWDDDKEWTDDDEWDEDDDDDIGDEDEGDLQKA